MRRIKPGIGETGPVEIGSAPGIAAAPEHGARDLFHAPGQQGEHETRRRAGLIGASGRHLVDQAKPDTARRQMMVDLRNAEAERPIRQGRAAALERTDAQTQGVEPNRGCGDRLGHCLDHGGPTLLNPLSSYFVLEPASAPVKPACLASCGWQKLISTRALTQINAPPSPGRHTLFMSETLLEKYGGQVPRYTSYPTANHFHAGIGAAAHRSWLAALDPASDLSLYLHVPYCKRLCWYCGCSTRATKDYAPVQSYARALGVEIERVAALLPRRMNVRHIHWGGGTPTMLSSGDFSSLMALIADRFAIAEDAEIAIEADPMALAPTLVQTLARSGVNRASIGVQDFDADVQAAIGRVQSVEATADAIEHLRAAGITAINIDLVYGLPRQTLNGLFDTLETVMDLAPERIALFGYAHVPWLRRNQRLIDEATLPGAVERLAMAMGAAELICGYGYEPIGIDHFARPGDPLAQAARAGNLHRNFQGYTTDAASALLGLGASAITTVPFGYTQNTADVAAYLRAMAQSDGLATVRGHRLDEDDRLRRAAIERLMCDFTVDLARLTMEYGRTPAMFVDALARLDAMAGDGLIGRTGWRIAVLPKGRPFTRTVAAVFDRYLRTDLQQHARAV